MTSTENIFTAKTVDEAILDGLSTLGLTIDEVEITVLEEGKKKLFGSVKAKVQITKKSNGGGNTEQFVDGLLKILGIDGKSEAIDKDECLHIEIKTENSSKVIGKRGDVLDAVQCLAGAVANIGRTDYKKVVVDCENYRNQREDTLKALAEKLAKKAVEKGRKLTLEPMNPYERRIIHSALANSTEVKTVSEGKEPNRYIAVIPNNARPNDRGLRYGERKSFGEREGKFGGQRRGERGGRPDRRGGERRSSSGGAKRGKKEIYFGAFLGNSGAKADAAPEENGEE